MPTYDYTCDACDHRFELFQQMSEAPVKKCPKCGAPKARRLIGPGAGFLFKGSGFYTTDYRSEDYKRRAKSEGSEPAKAEPKSEEKPAATSESKPAPKADSKTDAKEAKPAEKKSKKKKG